MNNELHLMPDHKRMPDSVFSGGVLTLPKAGDFTLYIKEYQDFLSRKSSLDITRGRTLADSAVEKEMEELKMLSERFKAVCWVWSTVYNSENRSYTQNFFVEKGIQDAGKQFLFPKAMEGGGFCYVEAFFEGDSPVGIIPNGLYVRAMGKPGVIRTEWTDLSYNPIGKTKVAFGSHLLLHIYTEGLYGQEILVGLKDVKGLNEDLKIANSDFFEAEVKAYPLQAFEENKKAASGILGKSDNPNQQATHIQKAVIEVGVDFSWRLGQRLDILGSYGNELEIESFVLDISTGKKIKIEDDSAVLKVSFTEGERKDYHPNVTNQPVVVGEIDTLLNKRKTVDFTFGVFLDGTLNNMYDTELRQYGEGKELINPSGISVTREKAKKIHKKKGDLKYSESSYENDLSNPAILYKAYEKDSDNNVFKIYTEGIGTHTAPEEQEGIVKEKDYKKNDKAEGPAFGMGNAGIMSRVKKSIRDVVKMIKKQNLQPEKESIGTITFDVFGFSRGAAAARHFVHVVTHGAYKPRQSWFQGENDFVKDLQDNDVSSDLYYNKLMPRFGVLGQLLTEEGLMDEQTQVKVRFVGIYDTVPHHGLFQHNDIKDLGLDNVNRAEYVVHMIAADEYRANFSLVDISSVTKTHPDTGKKGGMELIYPGVHCDVGGSYVEGGSNHPYRINLSEDKEMLEKEKKEFVRQGWFREEDLSVKLYLAGSLALPGPSNYYRLEGYKEKVSNQYSFIPLHIMAEFCEKKKVPVKEEDILLDYGFKENWISDKTTFLEGMKNKLKNYTFKGGKEVNFDNDPKEVSFLRYHYLHWNATYGDPHEAMGTWLSGKNKPNIEGGKRKRKVR